MPITSQIHHNMIARLRAAALVLEGQAATSPNYIEDCYPIVGELLRIVNLKINPATCFPTEYSKSAGSQDTGSIEMPQQTKRLGSHLKTDQEKTIRSSRSSK